MKINRNNYELFFIDYLDGKLSHSDELELMAFLAVNPDLEEELNLVKGIKIEPEEITYFDKKNLKKDDLYEIPSERFDELCIGKIEGTLSQEEELFLAQYLELNPEKVKELQLFEMTILKADTSVQFENKDFLKRIEISAEKFNELCIAQIENEISKEEEKILSTYVSQNPSFKREQELFAQTILEPDLSIEFPDKHSLKRKVIGFSYRKFVARSLSAAAAIALLFIAYNFFSNTDKHGNSPKMFATSIRPDKNIEVNNQVQEENYTNNNVAENQNNNIVNHIFAQNQNLVKDTASSLANKNVEKQDSTTKRIEILNQIENSNEKYLAVNQTQETNSTIDKSYDAIFAESKYAHFRDMTENVPFDQIQASNTGINNLNVWNMVEEGSKGISAITGADIDFKKKTNKNQKSEKYSFHIGRFGFSRTVHK